MKRNESIKTVMSADVTTLNVTQKPSEVRRIFVSQGIHHLPVVSGKKLVGLISATDIVKVSLGAYGADERAIDAMLDHEFTIEKIMTTELTTLAATATVRDAAELLSGGTFHSLPIVSDDNELVGIVTSMDIVKAAARGARFDVES